MYANPNDIFYSPLQLFSIFLEPWYSVNLTVGLMLFAGYFGWVLFAKNVMQLCGRWQHFFAFLITVNGFYFTHVAVGHYNFFPFPLLGYLCWLLFERQRNTWIELIDKTAIFSLVTALIIYGAGYYVLSDFILISVLFLPLDLCLAGKKYLSRVREMLQRIVCYGAGSILICWSKILSAYNFLVISHYQVGAHQISAGQSVLRYILNAFWALPQSNSLFLGVPWGLHEKSFYISHIVIIGLVLGLISVGINRKNLLGGNIGIFITIYSFIVFGIFKQIIQARGFVATLLFQAPIFSSYRVATRFLYPLSLWLVFISVISLNAFFNSYAKKMESTFIVVSMFITVALFAVAYYPVMPTLALSVDYGRFVSDWRSRKGDYYSSSVSEIVNNGVNDFNYDHGSGIHCYDAIYIAMGGRQESILHLGPVTDIDNKSYNLINPSCFLYGKENNCKPWDRILVEDKRNFVDFTQGKPVEWKISTTQSVADMISKYFFYVFSAIFLGITILRLVNKTASRR